MRKKIFLIKKYRIIIGFLTEKRIADIACDTCAEKYIGETLSNIEKISAILRYPIITILTTTVTNIVRDFISLCDKIRKNSRIFHFFKICKIVKIHLILYGSCFSARSFPVLTLSYILTVITVFFFCIATMKVTM